MPEDYLWDRSGEASAEEMALESQLGKYRHTKKPLKAARPVWLNYAVAAALFSAAYQLAILFPNHSG